MESRDKATEVAKIRPAALIAPEWLRALVFCCDFNSRCGLAKALLECRVTPLMVHNERELFVTLAKTPWPLLFCEDTYVGTDLCDILSAQRGQRTRAALVVISSRSLWETHLTAMRAGAFDYLILPASAGDVQRIVGRAAVSTVDLKNGRLS